MIGFRSSRVLLVLLVGCAPKVLDDDGAESSSSSGSSNDTTGDTTTVGTSVGTSVGTTMMMTDGTTSVGSSTGPLDTGDVETTIDDIPDPDVGVPGICGDEEVDAGEQCDGENLQDFDCMGLGLGNGTLACDPVSCTFNTDACTLCGNGMLDDGEQCDGRNLVGFDCTALGFSGGTLRCDDVVCSFDTSLCSF